MKIQLTIIAKGIKETKICTTEREVMVFYRDMPAKYELLWSNKQYAIQEKNL